MNAAKTIAIVLIIAGALGLVYQQFSFTKETTQAKLGPLEVSVQEKTTVDVALVLKPRACWLGPWFFASCVSAPPVRPTKACGSARCAVRRAACARKTPRSSIIS